MKVDLLGKEAAARLGIKRWIVSLLAIAMLLNVLLAAALVGLRGSEPWRTRLLAAGVLLLSLPVIKMIEAGVGNYGYVALWHYTFEGFVPHPGALASVPLQLRPFLGAVLNGVKENLGNGGLWSALLLLGSAAWLLFHAKVFWRDARTALLLAALFYLPARLFLFPSHDLRLMAPLIGGLTIVFIAVAGFVLASSTAASGAQVGILKWPVCDEVA